MEEGTLRLSNLKADVGAELWLMQSSLDEVNCRHFQDKAIIAASYVKRCVRETLLSPAIV